MTPITRRDFLGRAALAPVAAWVSSMRARPPMTVYKSPSCGCCKNWVAHVQKAGFTVTIKDVADVDPVKRDLGVPAALGSCHTAVLGAYVIEGHVPADVIDRLLAEKPAGRGLAVPGMPQSAPGMDVPGSKDHYDILLFTAAGKTSVYAKR